jgi:hypothetical protein
MPRDIRAASPPLDFRITAAGDRLEIAAAEPGEGGRPKPRRFSMTAYTGAAMRLGYGWPVVVDLAGMTVPAQARPVLRGHDPERIVGHTEAIDVSAQRIKASGVLSGVGEDARLVAELADNGFPWQCSIGASAERMEYVDRGQTVKVNGRSFDGPLYVARATTLGEISFVPMGADGGTSAAIAAGQTEGGPMQFEQWLAAKGFTDPAALSDAQRATLRAAFEAEQRPPAPPPVPPTPPVPSAADAIAASRRELAAEAERVAAIRAACGRHGNPTVEAAPAAAGQPARRVSLEAHAIADGWDAARAETRAELEALRAARPAPAGPFAVTGRHAPGVDGAEVLECGLRQTLGRKLSDKDYKPEVLEAARKHHRGIGLQQLVLMAAAQNGYPYTPGERVTNSNLREVLGHAFLKASGASSVSLPGILSNVANKELLAGYMEEDDTWREVAAVKSVTDFKAVTSYRMLDSMEYEELGPGGKIKGGSADQESYTRQAKTYAKMFALERTQIINDDLGAFDDLRNRLGRGAKKKFNNIFWAKFLADHAAFFTAARTNYITGANTTLLDDGVGLGLGVKAFRVMTSPSADGAKRVGGNPDRLVVPPELEAAAERLYRNQNLNAVKAGDANIYGNKYRPVVVPWLSDAAFAGNSATAWYLLRNPADLPMMVASFLNGQEAPTVESADADFDTLGLLFRGYHDFGADQAEYLCGIKSKGAA